MVEAWTRPMTQNWSISEGARKFWDRRVPYYLRVRDHFASLIEAGTLAPQSRLPSERVVGAAFGITRMTVRQALFQLEAEGLIYRLNRRGWFVSPPRLRYDPTANLSFKSPVWSIFSICTFFFLLSSIPVARRRLS